MSDDFDDVFGDAGSGPSDGAGFGSAHDAGFGSADDAGSGAPGGAGRGAAYDAFVAALPAPPRDFRWHDTERFGFAIAVPRRFHLLSNTVDPIAGMWRGRGNRSDGTGVDPSVERLWPLGLWDPEVVGEMANRRLQPFRLLEFDAIGGREEPLPDDRAAEMWFQARQMFPMSLESAGLPGYKLLDIHDTSLGSHATLAFEYRWDGLRPGEDGGDHALLFWAPSPWIVFHLYYHCSDDEWEARLPELGLIASTFRVLDDDEE